MFGLLPPRVDTPLPIFYPGQEEVPAPKLTEKDQPLPLDLGPAPDPNAPPRVSILLQISLFGLLAFSVFGSAYLLKPKPEAYMIVAPVWGYTELPFAENLRADRDASIILGSMARSSRALTGMNEQSTDLRKLIENLENRSDRGPLILYLNCLAVVRDGNVFLLPANAGLETEVGWVAFDEVIEAVVKNSSRTKGLVIDFGQPVVDPFRGELLDDVMLTLDRKWTVDPPPLPVLCSCSAGERSYPTAPDGPSTFAYFFAEGILGRADGSNAENNRDGRVSFFELAEFTKRRVGDYAEHVLGVKQVPRFYTAEGQRDFWVTQVQMQALQPKSQLIDVQGLNFLQPGKDRPSYPKELLAGWQHQQQLVNGPTLLQSPRIVADLTDHIHWQERLVLSHPADHDFYLRNMLNRFESRNIAEDLNLPTINRAYLTEMRWNKPEPDEELQAVIAEWRQQAEKDSDGTNVEAIKTRFGDRLKGKIPEITWLFWQEISQDPEPTAEKIQNLSGLLRSGVFRFEFPPSSVEWMLLKQLETTTFREGVRPTTALNQLFRVELAMAEFAAILGEPPASGLHVVRNYATEAVNQRFEAEVQFLEARKQEEFDQAAKQLGQAADRMEEAARRLKIYRQANRSLATAIHHLQTTMPAMVAHELPTLDHWQATSRQAAAVSELIEKHFGSTPPEPTNEMFAGLEEATQELQSANNELVRPFSDEAIDKLISEAESTPANPTTIAKINARLSSRCLSAESRVRLIETVLALIEKVYETELDRWVTSRGRAAPQHTDFALAREALLNQARRRADASIELLRLAGYTKLEQIEKQRQLAFEEGFNPNQWAKLGASLRNAWLTQLPTIMERAAQDRNWLKLQRALRAIPGGMNELNDLPTLKEMHLAEEVTRRTWMAERFIQYRKVRSGTPQAAEFFGGLQFDYTRKQTTASSPTRLNTP